MKIESTPRKGKFGAIILTEQQEAWLQKHFKHTKNEDIAKKLGVSPRSVNRLAEKRGLTKSRQFIRKTQLDALQLPIGRISLMEHIHRKVIRFQEERHSDLRKAKDRLTDSEPKGMPRG